MRLVFISTMTGYPWGGSEELWSQTAARLKGEGHTVAASMEQTLPVSPKLRDLESKGIHLRLRVRPRGALLKSLWQRLTGLRPRQAEKEWLLAQQPELVVISQGGVSDGLDWMKFCREHSLPYVAIVQSASDYHWPTDAESAEIATVFRSARRVFFVSRRNQQQVELQIGESLPNGEVVFNPNKVAGIQPPPWPVEDGTVRFACVARLEPAAKGQDLLLQVLSSPAWRERRVELNLYGSGIGEKIVRQMVTHLGLRNVRFPGHVDSVADIWKKNHMLVLPSRYEGLPLTLVEAMSCARPAIVTDVGGNAELCLEGQTGFVAVAPVVTALAETMERAWQRRNDWPAMGWAARERIQKVIPRDPVGDFCARLLRGANGSRSST